jgi:hypothetical protein
VFFFRVSLKAVVSEAEDEQNEFRSKKRTLGTTHLHFKVCEIRRNHSLRCTFSLNLGKFVAILVSGVGDVCIRFQSGLIISFDGDKIIHVGNRTPHGQRNRFG